MKVSDLMSREVLTATPETPLKEAAGLLARKGISGVPILIDERWRMNRSPLAINGSTPLVISAVRMPF